MDTGRSTASTSLLRYLGDGQVHCLGELADALGRDRKQVSKAAAVLAFRGYVRRETGGCYVLTDAGLVAARDGIDIRPGPKAPSRALLVYKDTFRARAWKAMHVRRCFTIGDVLADAQREGEIDQRANLSKFVHLLTRAGYLAELPRRRKGAALTSPGHKQFVMRRYTGPLPPIYRESRHSFTDQNTREDFPCAPR